ncbi:hypothetical protein Tco_0994358 [Tanacetum coccineum]
MNHICKEVRLHSNMADLESNLITKVSDDIKSTMPTLINNVLQEQLPSLLSATLIKCLPTILIETLQAQVSTVSEQLAQTQTTLNKQTLKKIKKQFAISHQTECENFVVLQKALTNVLRSEIDQSVTDNVLDMLEISNLLHSVDYDDETTEGVKTKKESENPDTTQGEQHVEPENEESVMILHTSEEKKKEAKIVNVADSTDSDDFDTQPLSKKFKISPSIPDIINPNPLISPSIPDIIKPTPLSLILPELPIKDKSKGKEVAKDESMLEITSLLEEGGSTQKTLNLKDFSSQRKTMTIKEATAQLKEIQRLANLKKAREESEKQLKRKLSQWDVNQAKKVGLPPPPELATLGMSAEDKKQKRTKFLKEMFVTEDIRMDRMYRNLTPPIGIIPIDRLVIAEPKSGIFFMNKNINVAFQRESEFHLTPTV